MPVEENVWNGPFDPAAYESARRVLEQDRERATSEVKAELARRGRLVGVVVAVWAVCSVVLAFVNADLLLVAEIGWTAIVIWAVFFLIPTIMGRGNLDELFSQYEVRLAELEASRVPLPEPADMPDLVAALDLVSLPDE